MPPTDAELLERWQDGDVEAGGVLLDRYYKPIERFFRNKVSSGLEDLIQRTFTACIEGRDRVRKSSSFRSYLFGVAHNLLREHLRGKYRRNDEVDFDAVSLQDLATGPFTLAGRQRQQRLLLEALRQIPLSYQVLLELHYWEEMTTAEMAEVLAIPLGTTRGRLRRARELLEQAMAEIAASPQELRDTLTRLDDWAVACRQEFDAEPDGRGESGGSRPGERVGRAGS